MMNLTVIIVSILLVSVGRGGRRVVRCVVWWRRGWCRWIGRSGLLRRVGLLGFLSADWRRG